ncbi:MAG: hypothetical protein OXE92_07640 [Bacteroidetes bacterium]|nr:hypothetical protein [Bacteroidota bacterium]MCY4205578.1 hypothetical protein [Bacteroidota bacterium]
MTKRFLVEVGDERISVTLSDQNISLLGENMHVSLVELRSNVYSLLLNGNSYLIHMGEESNHLLTINGETVKAKIISEREQLIQHYGQQAEDQESTSELRAPMPGLIMKILTQAGDHVTKGQGLVVLEAMKMENELHSPCEGIVKQLHAREKDAVALDELLIEFES